MVNALYPIFLQLEGTPVLVLGGGRVASRRARMLVECGARVTVVSPVLSEELAALERAEKIAWIPREFEVSDLQGASLVLSATGRSDVVDELCAHADRSWLNLAEDAQRSHFHVPAVARRGPVTVAVSTGGVRPAAAARLRDELQRWLNEHGELVEALFEAAREGTERSESPGSVAAAGTVYLVGAGPGDPGLLTLRAAELLERADVVFYDRLVSEAVRARIPSRVEQIYVGKDRGVPRRHDVPNLLVEAARAGKVTVRLKGGDPLVFGRAAEEMQELSVAGVPYEVVPGVSALTAAPAAAGIPLTMRGVANQVIIRSGHPPALSGDQPAEHGVTLVYFMPAERLDDSIRGLEADGTPATTPVAVIQKGTLPGQRVLQTTLGDLSRRVREERLETPALLVVGELARFASQEHCPALGPRAHAR